MKQRLGLVLCFFVAILIGCGQSESRASADDIVGLRIGITPEEARIALAKINATFKIQESRDRGWNALVITATGSGEKILLKFTESNAKAWFIGRSVAFPPGQRPTRADLNKDLIAKYGKASESNLATTTLAWTDTFAWAWASNQKQEFEPLRACGYGPMETDRWMVAGAPPFYQWSVSRTCSKLIYALVGSAPQENVNIAGGLAVSIMDGAMALSDPKHPANAAADNARQQLQEASKNKPRL